MKKSNGFTLIELLVVIAIIALLVAYAVPNYRQYVMESKRTGAQNKLMEIAGMYQKFYANTNAYPTALTGGGAALSLTTGYLNTDDYAMSVVNTANGWTLTATAINGQAEDSQCPTLTFNNLSQKGPLPACWE